MKRLIASFAMLAAFAAAPVFAQQVEVLPNGSKVKVIKNQDGSVIIVPLDEDAKTDGVTKTDSKVVKKIVKSSDSTSDSKAVHKSTQDSDSSKSSSSEHNSDSNSSSKSAHSGGVKKSSGDEADADRIKDALERAKKAMEHLKNNADNDADKERAKKALERIKKAEDDQRNAKGVHDPSDNKTENSAEKEYENSELEDNFEGKLPKEVRDLLKRVREEEQRDRGNPDHQTRPGAELPRIKIHEWGEGQDMPEDMRKAMKDMRERMEQFRKEFEQRFEKMRKEMEKRAGQPGEHHTEKTSSDPDTETEEYTKEAPDGSWKIHVKIVHTIHKSGEAPKAPAPAPEREAPQPERKQ